MNDLEKRIIDLKNSEISEKVDKRIEEFERVGMEDNNRWFSELSFCVLTANSSAQLAIDIQDDLGSEGFIELPLDDLVSKLESHGYRFYNKRAEYIVENRKYSDNIRDIISDFSDPFEARDWLIENVKGLGCKESSHFLRNVGYKDLMIIDRHILRILCDEDIIEENPETLTKKERYLNIEEKVKDLSKKVGLSLAEIDLYLWYMETGKILK